MEVRCYNRCQADLGHLFDELLCTHTSEILNFLQYNIQDDQDLLDSDCNTALHIATLEKTGHKLKLNVIQELIGIRCSPHKKNSQNKLAIDNLTKDKDTKSKKWF
jgi:hypothetical protein